MIAAIRQVGLFRILCVCAVLLSACGASGFSTPDPDCRRIPTASEELCEAEQNIRDTLAEAKKILTAQDYTELMNLHTHWKKNEFKANLRAYQDSGLSETEAWIVEVGGHADSLSQAAEVLQLRREGKGVEGVYERNRNDGGAPRRGMLLIRQMDGGYNVSLEASGGTSAKPAVCGFQGDGELRGNVVDATSEEEPEARLIIVFEGSVAKVTASRAAEAQCDAGLTLEGAYRK